MPQERKIWSNTCEWDSSYFVFFIPGKFRRHPRILAFWLNPLCLSTLLSKETSPTGSENGFGISASRSPYPELSLLL